VTPSVAAPGDTNLNDATAIVSSLCRTMNSTFGPLVSKWSVSYSTWTTFLSIYSIPELFFLS